MLGLGVGVLAAVTATFGVTADLDRSGVARVGVEIVLRNPDPREAEYDFLFPASPRAVLDSFRLTDEDKPLTGRAYPAAEARAIYEEIVRRRQDPALLEFAGRALFRARVFPVPARGEMRLRLAYVEPLETGADGLFEWSFPLAADTVEVAFGGGAAEAAPTIVYSPTHDVKPRAGAGGGAARWSWRAAGAADRRAGTTLLYGYGSGGRAAFDARALTYRPDPARPGYFALLLSPQLRPNPELPRDVTLVIDRSGSMAGEKMEQARAAAKYILASARPGDRVRAIFFSDRLERLGTGAEALAALSSIEAHGGTNIHDALLAGLAREAAGAAEEGRPHAVIFLTDGLPTIGRREPAEIWKAARAHRTPGTRVFVFGVGHDVNGVLLDRIAADGRGLADYVRPEENVVVKVSDLYRSIRDPVLTDVAVEVGGVRCFDVYPRDLGDIFAGRTLLLTGRFRGEAPAGGVARVTVRGRVGAEAREFAYDVAWPAGDRPENAYVGRLFAARRIAWLVDEVRLNGSSKEVVDEIVRLGTEWGILTEYTSFLIEDGVDLAAFDGNRARCEQELARRTSSHSGSHGFSQAANTKVEQGRQQVKDGNYWLDEQGRRRDVGGVRQLGAKTFFRRGSRWIDSTLPASPSAAATATPVEVVRVPAFSERWFALARSLGRDACYLAVGNATVAIGGRVYEIVEPEAAAPSEAEKK